MQAAGAGDRMKIACVCNVQCRPLARAMMMRHSLVAVALRLIGIAIFMHDAGAIHHELPGNLARMNCRGHHQR